VLKARGKHTQERNSERNKGARAIVDTGTPRMTAQMLVNELVSVLYPCQSDVQVYRPTSVVKMVSVTIDIIRSNHSSTESMLKMLLHLGCLTEHGTYQRVLVVKWVLVESKNEIRSLPLKSSITNRIFQNIHSAKSTTPFQLLCTVQFSIYCMSFYSLPRNKNMNL